MLRDAIEALRKGDRAKARDLLTRLLKTDQKNAQYWVWLSAAVETQKERLYCLQMAIKADPQNVAARRGLVLLGALPPDPAVKPFPLNRPRLWEEKLAASLQPEQKLVGWANPLIRIFTVLGAAVLVVGLFLGGYMLWPKASVKPPAIMIPTHRPTLTLTFTATATVPPSLRTATPTFLGPTPLWMFLDKTYTPTPLYVSTQHPVTSQSAFNTAMRFMAQKDYRSALALLQQAEGLEPAAADITYYIGEVYRLQGDLLLAKDEYQKAIQKKANFAPAFLGRALANLALDPGADVSKDLNAAVQLDPGYMDAYLERGKVLLPDKPAAAEANFQAAVKINPNSALAWLYLADAQLALNENNTALVSAQKANQIDITLIPVYLTLAKAYIATGQGEKAVSVLQTYSVFEPKDSSAFLAMGIAYNAAGSYQDAVTLLNKALNADPHNAEAFYQRGTAYLALENASLAATDFKSAITYAPADFDAQLGLARTLDMQKKPGDAYMQAYTKAEPLAKTDSTRAQAYYWEATFLEEMNEKPGAQASWYRLIGLPAGAMPAEWRATAFEQLNITPTFTVTLTPTITPTFTRTPTITKTPSATATPTATPK